MEQPININKNQHAVDVLKQLDSFRQKKQHCDFLIKAGKREIAVHRYVVSACSEYFESMLSHDTLENRRGVVEMKEVDPGSVVKCVDFMYTGEASVSEDNREQLMHVAHMLQLPKLYNGIALFLEEKLDSTSFFATKNLANLYNCERLVGVCNEFALQHFRDIAQLEEFKELDEEYVRFLVGSEGVKVNEALRCKALIGWIKHDASRKSFLVEMIGKLDLLKISSSYKRFLTENEPVVYTSVECLRMLMMSVFDAGNVRAADVKTEGKKGIAIFDATSKEMLSFDIDSKSYTELQPLKSDMAMKFSAVAVGQHLYVFTNGVKSYRIDCLDLGAKWEELPDRNLSGYGPSVVLEGMVYTSDSSNSCTKSMERFDPSQNNWTVLPRKNSAVHRDAVAVAEGKILCIGGADVWDTKLARVLKYNPVSSTWSNDGALNTARHDASATSWENGVYVLGGYNQNALSNVEYRCPMSTTWSKITRMNVARHSFSAIPIGGRIYAVGGDKSNPRTIEEYDPDTKQWKMIETMDGKRPVPLTSVALTI